MIVALTLLPELTEPLGLKPGPTLTGFGDLVAVAGPNDAGKTRLLSLLMRMVEDAAGAEQARQRCAHRIAELERETAAGSRAAAHVQQELEAARVRLAYLDRVAEAIEVDGPRGPEPLTARDTCIMFRHPWTESPGPLPADRVFAGATEDRAAREFAAAYETAPETLAALARAMFHARHAGQQPDTASREAEELDLVLDSLLGERLDVEVVDGDEVVKLGDRELASDQVSPGERVLIAWALLLYQKRDVLRDAIILIDEPESHLHPDSAIRLLAYLRGQVNGGRGQIWIASHSPSLLFYAGMPAVLMIEDGAVRRLLKSTIPRAPRRKTVPGPGLEPAGLRVVPGWLPAPTQAQVQVQVQAPAAAGERRLAVGTSDFRNLRRNMAAYVDTTGFVAEVLENPAEVLLIPRPRRFGKTLNLSTLRYFIEKSAEDRRYLFHDLAVWKNAEARRHFGRYPVIFLTFKDVKQESWESCQVKIAGLVAELYGQHSDLIDGDMLKPHDKEVFAALLQRTAAPELCEDALRILSRHLCVAHGERAVILIDEYDTPLHTAFHRGYYDQAVAFFRNFLSGGLKDNEYLFKGVLTGILRVAKESLFSGLNNLAVYTLLRPEFATSFGFTEDELRALSVEPDQAHLVAEMRDWYNGYLFGGEVIYNPWSVANFLASKSREPQPYWVDTSSNDVLEHLLLRKGLGLRQEMTALLAGQAIEMDVKDNIVLRDLDTTPDAVWSLLLFSGYLCPADAGQPTQPARIKIPNKEVRHAFDRLIRAFVEERLGGGEHALAMLHAMLNGNTEIFERHLGTLLVNTMSYMDLDGHRPEKAYQVFILGVLTYLYGEYEVKSEAESGLGRADLRVRPRQPGKPGVVLELKVRKKGQRLEQAFRSAFDQIERNMYTAALSEWAAQPIHTYAIVFDGKQVWVRRES